MFIYGHSLMYFGKTLIFKTFYDKLTVSTYIVDF